MRMRWSLFLFPALLLLPALLAGQGRQDPGHPIGTARIEGNLIVLTLNEAALGKANMFDLDHRTLRFTPEGRGYRVANGKLDWDSDFGPELNQPNANLHGFAFPFSGKTWDTVHVGVTGSLGFGGAVTIGRFDQLQEAARTLINGLPSVCVFMKPRMSGRRYFKELADRAVITWDVTEPYGGIQDFTWTPTVNRFQAVLHKDGAIDMSYDQLAARDAIVGIYPAVRGGDEKLLDTVKGDDHPGVAAHLDIRAMQLSAVDGLYLKVALETRGPLLPANDPQTSGIEYRVSFGSGKQPAVWTVRAVTRGGRGGGGARYVASGSGVSPAVTIKGSRMTFQGTVPPALSGLHEAPVSAAVMTQGEPMVTVDELPAKTVTLTGIAGLYGCPRDRHRRTATGTRILLQSGPVPMAVHPARIHQFESDAGASSGRRDLHQRARCNHLRSSARRTLSRRPYDCVQLRDVADRA
jgi:hypothetical protein